MSIELKDVLPKFEEIFSYLPGSKNYNNDYSWKCIYYPVINDKVDIKYAINFHINIKKVFYYEVNEGEDQNNSCIIGELKNGNFFYFKVREGSCGLEVSLTSDIKLMLTSTYENLISYALEQDLRTKLQHS